MNKNKLKLISVKETINGFYDALENGGKEELADYFETLLQHYKNRVERVSASAIRIKTYHPKRK